MKQYDSLAIKIILAIAAVFAPAKEMIIAAFVLILADAVLGILAAKKRGEPISSAGLRRTVVKMFVYEAAICLSFLVQQYLTGDLIPCAKIAASFVGITELMSCLENLNQLSNNGLLKALLAKLGSANDKPQ